MNAEELIGKGKYSIKFDHTTTEDQKLAIATCPAFDKLVARALDDVYDWKTCECGMTRACFQGIVGRIDIAGNCPRT